MRLLQASPEFRHASRRLLADLVDRSVLFRLRERRRVRARLFLLVVIDGTLSVTPAIAAVPVPRAATQRGAYGALLNPGVYWHDAPALDGIGNRPAELTAVDEAQVLLLDEARLVRLLDASPALANVAGLRRRVSPTALPELRAHLVWLARAPGLAVPLEAMAHLLAAAVGSQFAEPAGVVTVGGGPTRLSVWQQNVFRPVPLAGATAQHDIVDAFSASVGRPPKLHHLFYVHPADSVRRPPPFASQRFHRVVYVTDTVPTRIPHGLEKLLKPELVPRDGSGAHFSSFVPTVLANRGAEGFRAEPIDRVDGGARRARQRLRRDLCRVAIDPDDLAADWATTHCRYAETTYRWARAVTNRRVGVALSGGGACAYRTLPLLRMMREMGVPIDVVSGVSGGALMGAYYCRDGLAGLDRAERRGARFLLAMVGAVVWSGFIERQVDRDLCGARVDDLEVLFLPVTTELGDPPSARVVAGGTVGEAVRASAAAPVLFGPTRKGGKRYADGAAATMLPATLLTDHGADLTLACTCVPAPTHGNPFGGSVIGRLTYRLPPLGRLIDAWVATSLLLNTASRLAGTDAHVSWEPSGIGDPLREALRFDQAHAIVADASTRDGDAMRRVTARLYTLWLALGV